MRPASESAIDDPDEKRLSTALRCRQYIRLRARERNGLARDAAREPARSSAPHPTEELNCIADAARDLLAGSLDVIPEVPPRKSLRPRILRTALGKLTAPCPSTTICRREAVLSGSIERATDGGGGHDGGP